MIAGVTIIVTRGVETAGQRERRGGETEECGEVLFHYDEIVARPRRGMTGALIYAQTPHEEMRVLEPLLAVAEWRAVGAHNEGR